MQHTVDRPQQSGPGLIMKHYDHTGGREARTTQKLLFKAAVRVKLTVNGKMKNKKYFPPKSHISALCGLTIKVFNLR